MTKKEIKNMGFDRGYEFGQFNDNEEEAWESEQNARQMSPFEFTAKELNDLEQTKPYDVWDVYEEGIEEGIREGLKVI